MECPICKNKMGFSFGTCIKCGYNHDDHTYHFIEINTEILELLVPQNVFNCLVEQHEKRKRSLYKY